MSSSAFTPSTTTVTNNVPVNVPVVTAGELYTPTAFGFTYGSNGIEWTRQGDLIFIKGRFTTSATSGAASLSLPLNLTARTPGGLDVFCGKWVRSTAATNQAKQGNLYAVNGQSRIYFALDDYTLGQSPLNNMSATNWGGAGEVLSFEFTVAISEWAGSGTTTLATRAVEEYAFNTSTATAANDTTSFGYGSSGAQIQNITASLTRRVRFQTPIQATDKFCLEVSINRINWQDVSYRFGDNSTSDIVQLTRQLTATYGVGYIVPVNSTDIDVTFGQYAEPASAAYGSAGRAWSAGAGSWYWRVRKVSSGAQIGYPVSARNIVGDTSGSVVPVGMLGEVRTVTGSGTLQVNPSTYGDIAGMSLQLGPGTWMLTLKAAAYIKHNAAGNQINTVNLILTDSSNAVIANSPVQAQVENQPQTSGTAMQFVWNLTSTTVWTNTTTQSIKMRGLRSNLTGGIELLNDSDARITAIIATRIA